MGHRLSRIYTRTGDFGSTGLANGDRVGKDDPRIVAHGDLDELNSHIGWVLSFDVPGEVGACLSEIQHVLFDLGGDLCIPGRRSVTGEHVAWLERWLDRFLADLPRLEEFVLPGGNPAAAACHIARTVCRRAERALVAVTKTEPAQDMEGLALLNRLSDLLFVVARVLARRNEGQEILWRPRRPAAPEPR